MREVDARGERLLLRRGRVQPRGVRRGLRRHGGARRPPGRRGHRAAGRRLLRRRGRHRPGRRGRGTSSSPWRSRAGSPGSRRCPGIPGSVGRHPGAERRRLRQRGRRHHRHGAGLRPRRAAGPHPGRARPAGSATATPCSSAPPPTVPTARTATSSCGWRSSCPVADLSAPVRYAELARALGRRGRGARPARRGPRGRARAARRQGHGAGRRRPRHLERRVVLHQPRAATRPGCRPALAGAPRWPAGEGRVKLPAAWLIEHAGIGKGHGLPGPAAVSTKHTLALTNRGGATAADVVAAGPRGARRRRGGLRGAPGGRAPAGRPQPLTAVPARGRRPGTAPGPGAASHASTSASQPRDLRPRAPGRAGGCRGPAPPARRRPCPRPSRACSYWATSREPEQQRVVRAQRDPARRAASSAGTGTSARLG